MHLIDGWVCEGMAGQAPTTQISQSFSVFQLIARGELDTAGRPEMDLWQNNRAENLHLPLGRPGWVAIPHGLKNSEGRVHYF